jgi:hypothetical protein
MALLTSDLHTVMKKDPSFLGVFALDRVPPIIKKGNVKLIINLDPATKPGSHWVAIWRKGDIGYYFDSFGRIPPPVIGAWLAKNSDSWTYNKKLMQSPKDKTACGYLCISFLTNKFSI